jgi:hypothetical protein
VRHVTRSQVGHFVLVVWLLATSASAIWFLLVEPFTERGRTRRIVEKIGELAETQDARRQHLEESCAEEPYVFTVQMLGDLDKARAGNLLACTKFRVEFCAEAVRAGDRSGFDTMHCDRVLSRFEHDKELRR